MDAQQLNEASMAKRRARRKAQRDEKIEQLVTAAMGFLHHDATPEMYAWESDILRTKFRAIL